MTLSLQRKQYTSPKFGLAARHTGGAPVAPRPGSGNGHRVVPTARRCIEQHPLQARSGQPLGNLPRFGSGSSAANPGHTAGGPRRPPAQECPAPPGPARRRSRGHTAPGGSPAPTRRAPAATGISARSWGEEFGSRPLDARGAQDGSPWAKVLR